MESFLDLVCDKKRIDNHIEGSTDIVYGDFEFGDFRRNLKSFGNFPLLNFLFWLLRWYQVLYLYFDWLGWREAGLRGGPPLLSCTQNGNLWLQLAGVVPHLGEG